MIRYKEADFPVDYRETEVRQIMETLYRLRSMMVTGLAGMGKSNVLRFVVSHPQARARYLKDRAEDTSFLHIDCAALAHNNDEEPFLSEIVAHLHCVGVPADPSRLPPVTRDTRHLLRDQLLRLDPDLNLVLVLDYFDVAAQVLGPTFYNYLFSLRNVRPRANLSVIFAARRPFGHLYEFHELLDESCIVGPLSDKDALGSLARDEARLGRTLQPVQRERLIAITGGHPGFLKNAAELVLMAGGDTADSHLDLGQRLLNSEKVVNLCEELWQDLTAVEQDTLLKVLAQGALSAADKDTLATLRRFGLLNKEGEVVRIFCPLFADFITTHKLPESTAVRIVALSPNRARITTGLDASTVELSPRLFALLLALTERRGEVLTVDVAISCVYGAEAPGVSNAALSQLVKRLRSVLDTQVQQMTDSAFTSIETIRGVGYRFCA